MNSNFTTWEDLITSPHNQIRQVSTFFSRSLFEECGLINEDLDIAMDMELFSRITKDYMPTVVADFVSAFRVQDQSKSLVSSLRGYKEIDHFRKLILAENVLLSKYCEASSVNWLNLAGQKRFAKKERINCLKNALNNNPKNIISRRFWSTLLKMIYKP